MMTQQQLAWARYQQMRRQQTLAIYRNLQRQHERNTEQTESTFTTAENPMENKIEIQAETEPDDTTRQIDQDNDINNVSDTPVEQVETTEDVNIEDIADDSDKNAVPEENEEPIAFDENI